jgi:nitrite reductase/ring-hydroxylating ferredoxin subunit
MANRIELCNAADVTPGNALKVETDDLTLAVFNVDGEFYVTDDACTHGPGSLSKATWWSAISTTASSTSRPARWSRRPA